MKSAIGVAAFHVLIGYALLVGLGVHVVRETAENVKMFDVLPEPPPPPVVEPPKVEELDEKPAIKNPEGAASPKNLRDTPTPIVAPVPPIPLPIPSPVVAAVIAGVGDRPSAGASDVPGPGAGSGGQGTGLGSGSAGNGTGGGGGGGAARRARYLAGAIRDSDKPRAAYDARASGTVYLRFTITPTGRVRDCRVTRSSGRADLDEVTCRLLERRLRYAPARNGAGEAIAQELTGSHYWGADEEREPIDVEPDVEEYED